MHLETSLCELDPMVKESASRNAERKPEFDRVLVVEDDPDMCDLLTEALSEAGFRVDSTGDGAEGRKLASLNRYQVVVSDVCLPGLSGIDLARELAALEPAPEIILITAFADPETFEEGFAAGARHVLAKPVSLRKLTAVVRSARAEWIRREAP